MKIIMVGAGRVGQQLARELASYGHDLVLIEKDAAAAALARERFDVTVIHGDALDFSLLKEAATGGADMLVAVSESDEVNLTVCLLASGLDVGRKIARIRNEGWFSEGGLTPPKVGLDHVIHPELETVDYLTHVLGIHGAFDYAEFAGGEVVLVGFNVVPGLPLIGHSLADLREMFALDSFLIIGIYRDNEFIVPHGGDTVAEGDKLWLLAARETLPFVFPIFKRKESAGKERAVVLGASRIGMSVAEAFKESFKEVVLLETDHALARSAAERLEGVKVMKASVKEGDPLGEIGPETIDCFVAASTDERKNLMSGLLAKRLGVERVAVVTDEAEYMPVMDAIGLDVVVNPHFLTAGAILRLIRKGLVYSVVKLRAGEAELVEYDVAEGSRVAGKSLAQVGLPRGSLVGTIRRGDDIIIPSGATALMEGDRVVVVASTDKAPEVEKLFGPRRFFF